MRRRSLASAGGSTVCRSRSSSPQPRAKLLAPAEILERLEREPNLLPAGPRDAPARQQTLAATIRWSYDLLGPAERLTFARLGVFVGGCTLEAAEQVCQTTLETLGTLVDNNLLRRRDSRFMMLETVRHFAVERLEEAGAAEVRLRHAEWLTELAESLEAQRVVGDDVWLDLVQPEHDNARAALAWSLEEEPVLALRLASGLKTFWEVRGHFSRRFSLGRGSARPRSRRTTAAADEGAGPKWIHRDAPRQPGARAGTQRSRSRPRA